MMSFTSGDFVFTLFYIILSYCLIYPPNEVSTAGFTIAKLCQSYLGSEDFDFIQFHIKRTIVTLLTFALLPFGYVVLLSFNSNSNFMDAFWSDESFVWRSLVTLSISILMWATVQILIWSSDTLRNHPFAIKLAHYGALNNMDWITLTKNINREFIRDQTISIQINNVTKVIVTENWLMRIGILSLDLINQSDAILCVTQAEDIWTPVQSAHSSSQMLNIRVESTQPAIPGFIIRIKASDFDGLQARITRTIRIPPDVLFHKSINDEFVHVFKETIRHNEKYNEIGQELLDQCIGCMQVRPNVKLQKLCVDDVIGENCVNCLCRPMWCVDCMAKWFASRQDIHRPESWLSSKCTCPMCRARFCILDVSLFNDE